MEKCLIDKFINDLYLFVEDDYLSPVHNFNRDLKYSVKELDEHYNSGYRDLFDAYYKDFILLKELGNYENIVICYDLDKDDYFFEVDIRQMVGAEERKEKRIKEIDEILDEELKLLEEGKLDEVRPFTKWFFGEK
jgi:hypothetical protein